jgi:hypothetical protein
LYNDAKNYDEKKLMIVDEEINYRKVSFMSRPCGFLIGFFILVLYYLFNHLFIKDGDSVSIKG